MLKPLAFVCVGSTVVGSQLVSRLEDLGYRAETINDAADLSANAPTAKPFVIICDLASPPSAIFGIIKAIRQNPATSHIPVLGIARDSTAEFQAEATAAGATLVVMENGVLAQLPQLLAQALAID